MAMISTKGFVTIGRIRSLDHGTWNLVSACWLACQCQVIRATMAKIELATYEPLGPKHSGGLILTEGFHAHGSFDLIDPPVHPSGVDFYPESTVDFP